MTARRNFDRNASMALDPFYTVLVGDSFMETQWKESLQEKIPQPCEVIKTDTKSQHVSEIIDLLYTYPMLGSNRLIEVTQIKELDEKYQDKLLAYCDAPTMQTTVIWKLTKMDKRKKFYKTLVQKSKFISLETPKLAQMSSWVDRFLQKHGLTIDREAKMHLIDFIGVNLGRMHSEIEKLALYIHPAKKITKEDVFTMVLKLNGDDIFACTDAVIEKNAKQALENIQFLFESGVNAFAMLSMFTRHIRILMKVQSASQNSIPRNQLASYVGVPPFTLGKYQQQTRKFTFEKCTEALKLLSNLDTEMKSTGIGQTRLMEKAVISLIRL